MSQWLASPSVGAETISAYDFFRPDQKELVLRVYETYLPRETLVTEATTGSTPGLEGDPVMSYLTSKDAGAFMHEF